MAPLLLLLRNLRTVLSIKAFPICSAPGPSEKDAPPPAPPVRGADSMCLLFMYEDGEPPQPSPSAHILCVTFEVIKVKFTQGITERALD